MTYLRSTSSAIINGATIKGMPIILGKDYAVDWVSLEYFLDLYRQGVAVSSIYTYGSHLADFLSQLEADKENESEPQSEAGAYDVGHVTDAWIKKYKKAIKDRLGHSGVDNKEKYAAQVVSSVVRYLYWLEGNHYIRGVIGVGKKYKVRINEGKNGIKHPEAIDKSKDKRKLIAPRTEWVEIIKPYGPKRPDLALRFELMIDWCDVVGLRAMEVCALRIEQLPVRKTVENAILHKRRVDVCLVKTKGGKVSTVPVSPLLIKKTLDYIDSDRDVVVDEQKRIFKHDYRVYVEPPEIFLSANTGGAITPRAFSNSVRSAFKKAVLSGELTVDERVWVHGLRHNFVDTLLKRFDKEGVKRPEQLARLLTRHSSVDSMEPYMVDRFNGDFHG